MTLNLRTLTGLVFVLSSAVAFGQANLVSNQSLETYTTCPTSLSQLNNATGWGQPTLHIGSPDYFNACQTNTTAGVPTNTFGTTNANAGQAYAGGYTFLNYTGTYAAYREYVVATLTSALVAGQSYVVSFQYARSTNCKFASDAYGFYLSSAWPSLGSSGFGTLPVTPTSVNPTNNFLTSTSWNTYSDTIIAQGGELYLTIGSFTQLATGVLVNNSASINGAYMYVDDATVVIYNGIFGDSNICAGDTALIYAVLDTNHVWVDSAYPNVVLGTNDSLFVTPSQNTTYWAITYNDTFAFTVNVHNPPTVFVGNDTTVCGGDTFMRLNNLTGYGFLWSDNETDSALTATDSGYHWLEISIYGCTKRDSFHVAYHDFPEFELINDSTLCHYDSYYLSTGLTSPLLFQWNTGASTPGISIIDSGYYSVTVTNEYCSYSDDVSFDYYPEITVNLGQDKDFCYTVSGTITPVVTNANQYTWSTNQTGQSITVNTSGMYYLTVSNGGFCEAVDSVEYNFHFDPTVEFGDDTARFCIGEKVELNPEVYSSLNVEYLWNTADNSSSILTNQIGLFWVEVSNENCSTRDSIIIEMHDVIGVTLGEDIKICEGNSVTLQPKTNVMVNQFTWSDGSQGSSLVVSEHGTYSVSVSNGICSDVDQVNVFVLEYPVVDLGNDTLICPGDELTLDATQDAEVMNYNWSNGGNASVQTFQASGSSYWVQVSNEHCRTTDSINIGEHQGPSAYIGEDTVICSNEDLTLAVSEDPNIVSILWNTGDETSEILVRSEGEYAVSVTDAKCTLTDQITVTYVSEPTQEDVAFDIPNTICLGEKHHVDLDHNLFSAFLWQDGSTSSNYTIEKEGLYWVKASHECGSLSDSIHVTRCECPLWVPNAFNPNGDENNERFAPKLDCNPIDYQFRVFDRWGELIFETTDINGSWDGMYRGVLADGGAYAWYVTFTVNDHGDIIKAEESGMVLLLK
jgi:gliding motility-associated-like protein